MQFLNTCPDGMTLPALNEALQGWIEGYHTTVHSSTRQTPLNRYLQHAHLLREAPRDLDDAFRLQAVRRVDRDRTVSLHGRLYEAPVALIGKMLTLLYHPEDPGRVEACYEGRSQGMLVMLDLHVNCRVRRQSSRVDLKEPHAEAPDEDPETKYAGGRLFGIKEDDHGL